MIRGFIAAACLLTAGWPLFVDRCMAAEPSQAQQALDLSAQEQKHTFLLFYRADNQVTRAVAQRLQLALAQRGDEAALCYVSVTAPAEQAIVKQFGVARAPLPLVVAVAPNGAVTAVLSQKMTDEQISSAFVTAGMADCMKAMQERKLVLVCVQPSARSPLPASVLDFQSDPEFKNRIHVIAVRSDDETEEMFMKQMSIEPGASNSTTVVFLAPPAVLVGKFDSKATKAEMAAALQAAGKCCDDPNCNHKHGQQANKNSGTKRS